MSLREREEDERKNNCPSRGLGLAAAAIGVGVGAALYYFFNKRPENPDSEGSTSGGWRCEEPQAFYNSCDDSYTTISEATTSDTSMDGENDSYSPDDESIIEIEDSQDTVDMSQSTQDSDMSTSDPDQSDSEYNTSSNDSVSDESADASIESFTDLNDSLEMEYLTDLGFSLGFSESDLSNDWDVTNSSIGVPVADRSASPGLLERLVNAISPRNSKRPTEEQQINYLRDQAFRERSWSLEECSICFDIMLKDQALMTLPCTHNFHVACIGPWLQQHQTCPMCRKSAE